MHCTGLLALMLRLLGYTRSALRILCYDLLEIFQGVA